MAREISPHDIVRTIPREAINEIKRMASEYFERSLLESATSPAMRQLKARLLWLSASSWVGEDALSPEENEELLRIDNRLFRMWKPRSEDWAGEDSLNVYFTGVWPMTEAGYQRYWEGGQQIDWDALTADDFQLQQRPAWLGINWLFSLPYAAGRREQCGLSGPLVALGQHIAQWTGRVRLDDGSVQPRFLTTAKPGTETFRWAKACGMSPGDLLVYEDSANRVTHWRKFSLDLNAADPLDRERRERIDRLTRTINDDARYHYF